GSRFVPGYGCVMNPKPGCGPFDNPCPPGWRMVPGVGCVMNDCAVDDNWCCPTGPTWCGWGAGGTINVNVNVTCTGGWPTGPFPTGPWQCPCPCPPWPVFPVLPPPPLPPPPPMCPPGSTYIPPMGCVGHTPRECPPGSHYDPQLCACVGDMTCPPGSHYDPQLCACVGDMACPPGSHYDPQLRACIGDMDCQPCAVCGRYPCVCPPRGPRPPEPPRIPFQNEEGSPYGTVEERPICPPGSHYDAEWRGCVGDIAGPTLSNGPAPPWKSRAPDDAQNGDVTVPHDGLSEYNELRASNSEPGGA
ncbi:MAG: hypothetical protein LBB86_08225, partial [Oscillospiraceae bacterium]|nr:hypothetical protein [Oscillospiraceae bacterium]